MDNEALKAELALPAYAKLDDQAAADLLNAPQRGVLVPRGTISKDQFVLALQAGLAGIYGKPETDAIRQSFAGWLALLQMVTNIDTSDPVVLATLAAAVGAGVFSQAEVDAATKRAVSRAEQLLGAGATITSADVAQAMLPARQAVYEQAQAAIRAAAEELMAESPDMQEREALERADQQINGHDWGHK